MPAQQSWMETAEPVSSTVPPSDTSCEIQKTA